MNSWRRSQTGDLDCEADTASINLKSAQNGRRLDDYVILPGCETWSTGSICLRVRSCVIFVVGSGVYDRVVLVAYIQFVRGRKAPLLWPCCSADEKVCDTKIWRDCTLHESMHLPQTRARKRRSSLDQNEAVQSTYNCTGNWYMYYVRALEGKWRICISIVCRNSTGL
eukprot:scaffold17157_cov53-Attheya_sp.AAC.4